MNITVTFSLLQEKHSNYPAETSPLVRIVNPEDPEGAGFGTNVLIMRQRTPAGFRFPVTEVRDMGFDVLSQIPNDHMLSVSCRKIKASRELCASTTTSHYSN